MYTRKSKTQTNAALVLACERYRGLLKREEFSSPLAHRCRVIKFFRKAP